MPPEKQTPIGPSVGPQPQPFGDFIAQGADVGAADGVGVGGQGVAARVEEAGIGRVRVGAADEGHVGDVMGGDHARVGRMELVGQSLLLEVSVNGVDAVGGDQGRPFACAWR